MKFSKVTTLFTTMLFALAIVTSSATAHAAGSDTKEEGSDAKQAGSDTKTATASDPKAVAVLQKLSDYLAAQDHMAVNFGAEYTLVVGEQTEWLPTTYELVLSRPNDISLHMKNSEMDIQFVGDDDQTITYIPDFKQYRVMEGTRTASEILAGAGFGPIGPVMELIAELAQERPFASIIDQGTSLSYIAEEEIDGAGYDHIALSGTSMSADLWIATGDTPTLYRIVPTLHDILAMLKKDFGDGVQFDVAVDLRKWSFDDSLATQLAFTPPEGVQLVSEFHEPVAADALLGLPAPKFTAASLDNTQFDIASKLGDKIIVLDFWATWCGPCRIAMPILDKVSREFASEGVELYAVNIQEDAEDIREFLTSEGLDVSVVMDTEGAISTLYKVEPIPQTVIIGRDGTVQAVHIGVSPDLEENLRHELSVLAKGGSLVGGSE